MMQIPRVGGLSGSDIERMTQKDLEHFDSECLEHPKPLCVWRAFDQLHDFGIQTMVIENLGVEGMCLAYQGVITVILDNQTYEGCCDDNPRDRFSVSHEIGHALHHQDYLLESSMIPPALFRRGDLKPYEDPEWQAERYASALLMPADMVCAVLDGQDMAYAAESLMETFIVSRPAAKKRLENLQKMDII